MGGLYKDYLLFFLAANITLLAANLFLVLWEWVFTGLPTPVLLFAMFID